MKSNHIINPNLYRHEKLSEKLVRAILSKIPGTAEYAAKIIEDAITYIKK